MSIFKRKNKTAPNLGEVIEEVYDEKVVTWCIDAMQRGMNLTDIANKLIGCSQKIKDETYRTFIALNQTLKEENKNVEENQLKGLLKNKGMKAPLEEAPTPPEETKEVEEPEPTAESEEKVELTDEQRMYFAIQQEEKALHDEGAYRRLKIIEMKKQTYLLAKFFKEMSGIDPFAEEEPTDEDAKAD